MLFRSHSTNLHCRQHLVRQLNHHRQQLLYRRRHLKMNCRLSLRYFLVLKFLSRHRRLFRRRYLNHHLHHYHLHQH